MRRLNVVMWFCVATCLALTNAWGAVQLGGKAPDFSLPDTHGANQSLYALSRGKPLVLTFWLPDSQWSHQALDELKAFADQHASDAAIVAVAVSMPNRAKQVAQMLGLKFPVLLDNGTAAKLYGAYAYPDTFAIDSSGVIVFQAYGNPRAGGGLANILTEKLGLTTAAPSPPSHLPTPVIHSTVTTVIAVCLANLGEGGQQVSNALSSLLVDELRKRQDLYVIPPAQVQDVLRRANLETCGLLNAMDAQRIAKDQRAGYVIMGRITTYNERSNNTSIVVPFVGPIYTTQLSVAIRVEWEVLDASTGGFAISPTSDVLEQQSVPTANAYNALRTIVVKAMQETIDQFLQKTADVFGPPQAGTQGGSISPITIVESGVARSVSLDAQGRLHPSGVSTVFPRFTSRLVAYVGLRDIKAGQQVVFNVQAPDGRGYASDAINAPLQIQPGQTWFVWDTLSGTGGAPLQPGRWLVKVSAGDSLLTSLSFSIE